MILFKKECQYIIIVIIKVLVHKTDLRTRANAIYWKLAKIKVLICLKENKKFDIHNDFIKTVIEHFELFVPEKLYVDMILVYMLHPLSESYIRLGYTLLYSRNIEVF